MKTLKQMLKLNQPKLKQVMSNYLKKHYPKVIETEYYIIAEGDISIGLVAHLDIVYPDPPQVIFEDKGQGVLWSPDGLGADDRAGVYGIIKIIQSGLRPHIFLTTDEEYGGIGAIMLVSDYETPPFQINFLIELDRQGYNECVFYNCNNTQFHSYIQSFGFNMAKGSFSDISIICPNWDIAGVNLSVGYYYEHSQIEHFFIQELNETVDKVKTILTQTNIPSFSFKEEI